MRVECADAVVVVITSGHEVQLKLSRKMAAIKRLADFLSEKIASFFVNRSDKINLLDVQLALTLFFRQSI